MHQTIQLECADDAVYEHLSADDAKNQAHQSRDNAGNRLANALQNTRAEQKAAQRNKAQDKERAYCDQRFMPRTHRIVHGGSNCTGASKDRDRQRRDGEVWMFDGVCRMKFRFFTIQHVIANDEN